MRRTIVLVIFFIIVIANQSSIYANQKLDNSTDISIFEKQLSVTKDNYEKADELLNDGIISKSEYDNLKNKYVKAKENYQMAINSNTSENINTQVIKNPKYNTKKLKERKTNYDNLLELYEQGAVSEKELIDAEVEYRVSLMEALKEFNNYGLRFKLEKLYNPLQIVLRNRNYQITSQYGNRIHPITGQYSFHSGIDIAAPKGTPIYAYGDGVVGNSSTGLYSGNFINIVHGNNYNTLYLHLDSKVVKKGEVVKKGQIIGYVGSTGFSTGNHLHFEIRKNNIPQNINNLININSYIIVEGK